MVTPAGRKPIMALYSGLDCVYSHGCRIVLLEKEVECQVIYIDPGTGTDELAELNPYNETPTLIDRDLVLYGAQIINEYLDERLPHPPLMPVDPVNRGRARLMMMRFDREWLSQVDRLSHGQAIDLDEVRTVVRDGLIAMSPVLTEQQFLLGDEFSLVDCFLAPLLWRLPTLEIDLPRQARPVIDYSKRIFERQAFMTSMSEIERDLR